MKFIMEPLYQTIEHAIVLMYNIFGNYGISIIAVTILIKIILLPLTLKQDKSMKAMKDIQPEMEKIKTKYKNNPEEMNKKTMELYKTHKVNPAAGCLPLLIQMPILFALFGVLRKTAAEGGVIPDGSSFLWLKLAQPDPIYLLPILCGVVSYYQQKKMSSGSDNNQQAAMMLKIMPLMMVVIAYRMPSGLQLYFFISTAAAVVQQILINNKK